MAIEVQPYLSFLKRQFTGQPSDWVNDPIKMALMKAKYKPSDEEVYADVSKYETKGTNYESGGRPLKGRKVTFKNNRVVFWANTLEWDNLTCTFRYGILYKAKQDSPLIAWVDFGEQNAIRGNVRVDWDKTYGVMAVATI